MTDLFGHLCYALTLIGITLVGYRCPIGWLFRFVGEIIWIVIGFVIGMSSIWAWGFIFAALDFYIFTKWKNEQAT